jgi:predicted RecA/RadA family phage recombinase
MAVDINLTNVESTTNKGETVAGNEASTTKYLSIKGVYDWVTANFKATFSENTAFNKNFGTTSGTVAEGNDSRFNKNITVVQTTTSSGHTGNTNETILYTSPLIAADTIASGDMIELFLQVSKINTANNAEIKVYTNETADLVNNAGSLVNWRFPRISAANLSMTDFHKMLIDGTSTTSNISMTGDVIAYAPSGVQNARAKAARTQSLKWNEARYLILTVTLIDTTDTVTLECLQLKRDRA